MKPGRIPCLVPFCGRTFKKTAEDEDGEVICGKHFRLADKWKRRRLTKLRRIFMKAKSARLKSKAAELWWRQWDVIKAQAIERAMGA